jgi:ATP-dependent 26S proteasome regulatory subunit
LPWRHDLVYLMLGVFKVVLCCVVQDIGGCDIQKQEIREAVELPLTHHELYKQIGIDPPRGVLLYGPPGTGKTMLAKAVAHHTTAAFIRVVGSEFVQKYLGEVGLFVFHIYLYLLLSFLILQSLFMRGLLYSFH